MTETGRRKERIQSRITKGVYSQTSIWRGRRDRKKIRTDKKVPQDKEF